MIRIEERKEAEGSDIKLVDVWRAFRQRNYCFTLRADRMRSLNASDAIYCERRKNRTDKSSTRLRSPCIELFIHPRMPPLAFIFIVRVFLPFFLHLRAEQLFSSLPTSVETITMQKRILIEFPVSAP